MNAVNHIGIGMTSARTRERLVQRLKTKGIQNPRVLNQIRDVPRHMFVDEALASRAYEDDALPIGFGQTISQPYIVARMTETLLADAPRKKVLEIGTGCGYQAAVLAGLVNQVFTIERVQPLFFKARTLLSGLELSNIRCRFGDGFKGWPAQAPFDGIIVTASPDHVPEKLLSQLADGGVMLIPVGSSHDQQLIKITRVGDELKQTVIESVKFVPLLAGTT